MPMLTILYENAASLDKWLNMSEAEPLMKYLKEWRDSESKKLRKTKDQTEFREIQGKLEVLEFITDELQKDLKEHLRKKIGLGAGK
jgi:hypothetical protein